MITLWIAASAAFTSDAYAYDVGRAGCATCAPPEPVIMSQAGRRAINDLSAIVNTCPITAAEQHAYEVFTAEAPAGEADEFSFPRPRFRTDHEFEALPGCLKKKAVLECESRFADAMKLMDQSIAAAAVSNLAVTAFARKLANRLATIIDARAKIEVMGRSDRPPTTAERAAIKAEGDKRLLTAFGGCKVDQAGCLSHGCSDGSPTCVVREAHRLREALARGNLRESMFFLYTANDALTANVSRPARPGENADDVGRENESMIRDLNAHIRGTGPGWALTDIPVKYQGKYILSRTGYGADNNRMRDARPLGNGSTGCVPSTQTIQRSSLESLELMPLSMRETEFLADELHVARTELARQRLPFASGESCFTIKGVIDDPKYQRYNAFLDHAREAKIPLLTGISGTTDSLVTLGRSLGVRTPEEYELLRAAALGWLVSARDHSAHEVMTASQSFPQYKPAYRFRPDYYKSILPGHPDFAKSVERYAHAHGGQLPNEVLESCLKPRAPPALEVLAERGN